MTQVANKESVQFRASAGRGVLANQLEQLNSQNSSRRSSNLVVPSERRNQEPRASMLFNEDIKAYDDYPVQCAFVTFEKPKSRRVMQEDYSQYQRCFKDWCAHKKIRRRWVIGDKVPKLISPDNPETTNWFNFNISWERKLCTYVLWTLLNVALHLFLFTGIVLIFHSESMGYVYRCRTAILTKADYLLIKVPSDEETKCYCQGLSLSTLFNNLTCNKYAHQIIKNACMNPGAALL
jgi:hypothetical protein